MTKKKTKLSTPTLATPTLAPDEIVECPKCGQRFHSASALEDYQRHRCVQDLSDEELSKKLSEIPAPSKESAPAIIEVIPTVSLKSLPVGSKFEVDGVLYRKAFPINNREIGQKLVRHQFSATLMLGTAKSFDPNTQVIKR